MIVSRLLNKSYALCMQLVIGAAVSNGGSLYQGNGCYSIGVNECITFYVSLMCSVCTYICLLKKKLITECNLKLLHFAVPLKLSFSSASTRVEFKNNHIPVIIDYLNKASQ